VSKPCVVFTRPRDWAKGGYASEKLDLVYVPVSGDQPIKRNGRPAGDGIGDQVTKKGIDLLVKEIATRKPEVFFHSIHAKIGPVVLARIRALSPKTLIVVMDGNDPDRVSRYVLQHRSFVHAVLLNSRDPRTITAYVKEGFRPNRIGTLYDGFVPAEHPAPREKPKFDCFFAGSNNRSDKGVHKFPNGLLRQRFVLAVRGGFKLDLHGYSQEWGQGCAPRLNYPEYYQEFHRARIAINVNHLELERYYTRRTIHAGASGRMYVVKYIPGMEKDFGENGNCLAWFNTVPEGMDLISYYLENDAEREAAAAKCRKLFLERHSWQARLREFEDFVVQLLGT
jgi:hypothetical protein